MAYRDTNAAEASPARRAFLRAVLLGLPTAVVLAACAGPVASQATPPAIVQQALDADVLVVGAGAAGLAAGVALRDAGYNVRIVEGRERIGGRVWTSRALDGLPLDLGAAWIHGADANPLSELAARFDIGTAPTNYNNLQAYDSDGAPIDAARHARIDRQLAELLAATDADVALRMENGDGDISLQQAFDAVPQAGPSDARERRERDYVINTMIEHEYGADAAELSLFWYDIGFGALGGGDLLFPNGYEQIITALANDLPIERGRPVRRVSYGGRRAVELETDTGPLRAERAIITLPLGVLKAGAVVFAPGLPDAKQQSIAALGSGVLNKLYLRFPRIFWDRDAELLGYVGERKGEWAEWLNMAFYTGEPVLLGLNAGSYGRASESLNDAQLVRAAMAVLRTIYGATIPDPVGVLASRWANDPFALGSYSFMAPRAGPGDHLVLSLPVDERLFFAGEATSEEFPSTVHGALLSGRRAAAEIVGLG